MPIETGGGLSGDAGDSYTRINQPKEYGFPIRGPVNERIAQVVATRFEQSEAHHKGRFERFYRYEKLVNMVSKKKSYEWKSNAYLPYALAVAEQSAAIKYLALVGSRPYVTVSARQAGLEQVATHRETLLDWRFNGDINLLSFAADMFRVSERYGKAIALIAPDWDHKVLKYRAAVNLPTTYGPIARMVWKSTSERAYKIRCEMLDLTDCFPQPGFKRINGRGGMRYFMRRYYLTIDELRELESLSLWGPELNGQPVDDIKDTQTQDLNDYKARRLFMDVYDDLDRFKDTYDRTIEIVEYQGAVPDELIDPDIAAQEEAVGLNPKNRILTLANRKIVGINQAIQWDHGMKSYIEMDSVPQPYDFWGIGKVEPIEHLVYVGNEIVNMRIDNVKAAINGLIGVDGSRMPAGWKRRLVSQPWGVLETLGPPQQVIQRLPLGDVTSQAYQEQASIFSLIQEASAINETMMGAPGGAVRTLGEHQMKAQSATTRINYELVQQAQQLFGSTRENPGLVYFILSLDRQYLPLPQFLTVVDPWAPDDMAEVKLAAADMSVEDENFIYQAQGALEGMSKQARRMEFAQLNQVIGPMMQFMLAGGFNPIAFAKQAFRLYDLDPDKFFPKDPRMLGPDALGMGMGPGIATSGMKPGYMAGVPGIPGSQQPPLQQAGVGTQPGQNRYGAVKPGGGGGSAGQAVTQMFGGGK